MKKLEPKDLERELGVKPRFYPSGPEKELSSDETEEQMLERREQQERKKDIEIARHWGYDENGKRLEEDFLVIHEPIQHSDKISPLALEEKYRKLVRGEKVEDLVETKLNTIACEGETGATMEEAVKDGFKKLTPKISIWDDDEFEVKADLHDEPPEHITEGIYRVYHSMSKLIKEKNRRYGNSVMEPLGIFNSYVSEHNDESLNGILIRLDDKLKRIKNSKELRKNDVSDLMGYLAFLCVDKGWEDFSDLLD